MDNMDDEGQNHPATQGKLVLSASPEGADQPQPVNDQTSFMPAGNLQSSSTPGGAPMQPRESIFQKVRSKPVYQVLAAAIVVVLIAGSALVAFAATSMGSNPHNYTNQPQAKVQATATARSTQGSTIAVPTQASAPVPTQAPTPVMQQPTQPPQNSGGNPTPNPGGMLPMQFVIKPPQQASPDKPDLITVKTQPGLMVNLAVTYEVNNGLTENYTSTADKNGIATFLWHANNTISYTKPVSVMFTATAQNGNGDSGQAQITVTVVANQDGGDSGATTQALIQ